MQESESTISVTSASFASAWEQGLSLLRSEVDPQVFAAYIRPLRPVSIDGQRLEAVVSAPSRLVSKHVNDKFRSRLELILSQHLGVPALSLRLSVDREAADTEVTARAPIARVARTAEQRTPPKRPASEKGSKGWITRTSSI